MANSDAKQVSLTWGAAFLVGLIIFALGKNGPMGRAPAKSQPNPALATQQYWNHAIILCSLASESIYANPNELWGHERSAHIQNLTLIVTELEKTSMIDVDPDAIARVQELVILLRAKLSWIEESQEGNFLRFLAEGIQDHNQGTPLRGLLSMYQKADDYSTAMEIWASNAIATRGTLASRYNTNFPNLHCVLDRNRMKQIGERVRNCGNRFIDSDEYPGLIAGND